MIPSTRDEARAALAALGRAGEKDFDVMAAAIACAVHEDPDADRSGALAVLADLEAAARTIQPRTPEAMAFLLFADFGFFGALQDFDDPANASVPDTLVTRKGLPVAHGIIWRHVGKIADAPIWGTNMPGRFLMRMQPPDSEGPVLLDVFEGGAILDQEALALLAAQAGSRLDPRALEAVPDRVMAVRLQTNLATRAREDGRLEDWQRACERRALLHPSDGRLQLDLAEACSSLGLLNQARAAAEAATSDHHAHVATDAQALLERLSRRLN